MYSDMTMLIIGIIMKMIPQVIVFGFMYKFIRKYVGGYHCESSLTCFNVVKYDVYMRSACY